MAAKVPQTRHKKKDYSSFRVYIYKVLKQVHPDTGISGPALATMEQLVDFTLKKIMKHANVLKVQSSEKTMTSRHIQSAIRLCLPGELAKHAVSEGTKIVAKYVTTDTHRPKKSKDKVSQANVAGLLFPPPRVKSAMRILTAGCKCRISKGAPIYLAAVLEYIAAELLELSGNAARDFKKVRINTRHLFLAVMGDEELDRFFKGFVFSSGVVPHIHKALIPKKGATKPKKTATKKRVTKKKVTKKVK